jgi:hypothetical protein
MGKFPSCTPFTAISKKKGECKLERGLRPLSKVLSPSPSQGEGDKGGKVNQN